MPSSLLPRVAMRAPSSTKLTSLTAALLLALSLTSTVASADDANYDGGGEMLDPGEPPSD